MSTNLRYRVQSNAFVVDKSKEVKKPKFYKNLCCAPSATHGKDISLPCVPDEAHGKEST
jgi:hypothetical protein